MRISSLALSLAVIFASRGAETSAADGDMLSYVNEKSDDVSRGAFKEDASYWSRVMQAGGMSAPETPSTTPPPTPTPHPAVPKMCTCDVKITCADAEGTECNAVVPPPLLCPNVLETIRFKYTGGSCADSNNSQGEGNCLDIDGGPPADAEVLVKCGDGDNTLANQVVKPGDTIGMVGVVDGKLHLLLMCDVTSVDGATTYQKITIRTRFGLFLKDRYGSLEVESCNDSDCIVDVTYSYTLTNAGEAPITYTSVLRKRPGETVELIDLVPQPDLDVGESTVVTEPDKVDYCVASETVTSVTVFSEGEQCAVRSVRRGLRQLEGSAGMLSGFYSFQVKAGTK